ncbi:GFA family protein [Zhongshania guokunii]|uniref:GFA family protein n=1 Tax=Zhongshania guokunii TaxID=641783 RepID=A0ABV3U453_9GAMM
MIHSGSCLCGNVIYEYGGELKKFFLCHCQRCRKNSGSAHAANLFGRGGELVWLQGKDSVSNFKVLGTRHQRSFCSRCGSALPFSSADGESVVIPAGSLNTDIGLAPQAHIFMGSKASWDNGLEDVPRFAGFPI